MSLLRALFPYLWRYRGTLALGILFVVCTNAAALAGPWVLKLAIDDLTHGLEPSVLPLYFGLIVAVAAVVGCFRYLMRRWLIGLSRVLEYDLRNDLFARLTQLEPAWFARTPTGDLMNRLVNDLGAVRNVLGPGLMNLANTTFIFLAVLGLMLALDWRLTLIALAPMPLLSLAETLLGRRLHARYTAAQEELSALSNLTQENLAGVRVVRAYAQEDDQERRFLASASRLREKNLATARVSAAFHPLMSLLAGASLVLVLLFGGRAVVRGELSLGAFVAFQAYLALLVWPMIALGWVFNLFERGAASMRRLEEIFSARPAIADPLEPRPLPAVRGEIEARDVHFRHDGAAQEALSGVSFRVAPGGSLGILGETGAGKTSLVALLARLADPTRGALLLDGVDLRALRLGDLRRAIGFVPQETVLFSDTIRANVAFAPEGGSDEAVAAASRLARLDQEVQGFPRGDATRVGERGVTLSGGQKQRVAIARALIGAPPVLVLDDALSAVDAETEHAILERLRAAAAGQTRVIVSHRVSAVREADEILVLHEGRVAERGVHAELVARDGLYAAIHRRQQLEAEIETA